MTVSYEKFKKNELLVGIVKSASGDSATIDFGAINGVVECKTGKIKVSQGETVIAIICGENAKLLAVKATDGTLALLTLEKEAAPGTRVE